MPTTRPTPRNVEPEPKPLGDPQPPKPEINPVPTGDPKPAIPGQEPKSESSQQTSPLHALYALYASKKVDDLSRHEARHDEPLTRKPQTPNAREKPLDWIKPVGNRPPPGVKATAAELRA
jgi:hypothetical protein